MTFARENFILQIIDKNVKIDNTLTTKYFLATSEANGYQFVANKFSEDPNV